MMFFFHIAHLICLSAILRHAVCRAAPSGELATLDPRGPESPISVEVSRVTGVPGFFWAYGVPVTTGGKTFLLHIDTGAPRLWILSNLAKSPKYDHVKRYDVNPETFCEDDFIEYLDDSKVHGGNVEDTVVVGNDNGKIGLDKFQFVAATSTEPDDPLLYSTFSGSIGFTKGPGSFLAALVKAEIIPSASFTVNFRETGSSVLTFAVDKSQISGQVQPFPLSTSPKVAGRWAIGPEGTQPYIVDTGSPGIMLTNREAEDYYDLADFESLNFFKDSTQYWYVPCDAEMDEVKVKIGGKTFVVPGSVLKGEESKTRHGWCQSLLSGEDDDTKPLLLGMPFILQYVIIHDAEKNEIGIGKRA